MYLVNLLYIFFAQFFMFLFDMLGASFNA